MSLKIAFLTYGFGRYAYGLGQYGWYLTRELRRLGFEVDVFTANLHVKKMGPLLHSFGNLLRKLQCYDIVHSNEGAGLFVFHPAMIETYHHDYAQVNLFGYRFFHALENIECRKVQHIIVPSFASQNSLLRYGFPLSKVSVIYHGVDHRLFKKDEVSREKLRRKLGLSKDFVVINVGRFVKYKGQITLVKIMRKFPNSVLILVGKGEEEKKINEVALKMGVRILHFKDVSNEFLSSLYNAADVYVHTSTLEGFGLTILEAMACDLPVVAYKTADLDQIVGDTGYLLDVGDTDGIKSALWFLLENYDMRKRLGESASLRSKNFSWSTTAIKHAQVYAKVLKTGPFKN